MTDVLKKFPASFLKIEVTATVYRSINEVRQEALKST